MSVLPIKDPREIFSYAFSWANELATGETITSHTVTASGGLVVDGSVVSGSVVTTLISGGTAGSDGILSCQINTSGGQLLIDTATVPIRNKPTP